jgi:hypothetical protein
MLETLALSLSVMSRLLTIWKCSLQSRSTRISSNSCLATLSSSHLVINKLRAAFVSLRGFRTNTNDIPTRPNIPRGHLPYLTREPAASPISGEDKARPFNARRSTFPVGPFGRTGRNAMRSGVL